MSPATTGRLGLTKPSTSDTVTNLRTAIGANADKLDVAVPITIATAPPTSPVSGQLYLNTTQGVLSIWSGTEWIELMSGGGTLPVGAVADYSGAADPVDTSGAVRWMLADGRSLSQASYPELFAVLGSSWNAFDGQTAPATGSFRLPRLGRRLLLADSSVSGGGSVPAGLTNYVRGQVGGEELHPLLATEMPVHNHAITVANAGAINTGTESADHSHTISTAYGTAYVPYSDGAWVGETISAAGPDVKVARTNALGQSVAYTNLSHNHSASGRSAAHTHTLPIHGHTASAANNGSGTAHNNLPPYVVVGPKIIRVK